MNSHKCIDLPYFEFTEFQAFLCFYFQSRCFFEMFSEVITMFLQLRENFLTNLLWSFKLYQGAKMFLILITPHEKYDYKCQKQFSQHTCAISPEE